MIDLLVDVVAGEHLVLAEPTANAVLLPECPDFCPRYFSGWTLRMKRCINTAPFHLSIFATK